MPNPFVNLDINYPQFTTEQKTESKIDDILDYLFLVEEGLRYTLSNLDETNFNPTGLNILSDGITETLELSIGDINTAISSLQGSTSVLSADIGLLAKYTGNFANVNSVETTADMESWNENELYYVSGEDKYYIYNSDTETWEVTNPLTESIASIKASADSNGSEISLIASYSGIDSVVTVADTSGQATWDKTKIYYSQSDNKYYTYNGATSGWVGALTLNQSSASFILNALQNRTTAQLTADNINFTGKQITVNADNFSVSAAGSLKCNLGTIGNWTINSSSIYKTSSTWGAAGGMYFGTSGLSISNTFSVTSAGVLNATGANISGAITLGAGSSISWASVTAPSYSQIQSSIYDPKPPYNADNTTSTIGASRLTYIGSTGIYTGTLTADNITTGTINAYESVTLGNASYGGFKCATGNDGSGSPTIGAKMYGSDSTYYFIATGSGVRMTAADGLTSMSVWCTYAGIYSSAAITVVSDRNMKNSISYNLSDYDNFYMDLKPCFFKYNNDIRNTVYGGFVAQDLEESLIKNNLDLNNFTALTKIEKEKEDGTKYHEYGVRYTEFISLNTHMIQKAHKRIDELEKKLKELL